jgi:hypothetical protein
VEKIVARIKKTFALTYADVIEVIYSVAMAIENILAQIDSEIARLQQARGLLATMGTATVSKAGKATGKKGKGRKKRVLSADARKRIADAQRKRWAAVRAKAKKKA